MRPGFLNFLCSQAGYQHTVKINFKKKWHQRINKVVELNLAKLIVLSAVLIFSEKILTYVGHCLVYYTHNQ